MNTNDRGEMREALLQALQACELIMLAQQQTAAAIEPVLAACERGEPIPREVVAAAREQCIAAAASLPGAQQAIERFRAMLGVPSARH